LSNVHRILSHDLRGLVAGIRAMARQLREAERLWASSEGPEYVAEIERACDHGLETIDRLAGLLRDRDPAAEPAPPALLLEPADVGALLTRLGDRLRPVAAASGIALRMEIPAEGGEKLVDALALEADAERLVTGLLSLLPPGGSLEVRLAETAGGFSLGVSATLAITAL